MSNLHCGSCNGYHVGVPELKACYARKRTRNQYKPSRQPARPLRVVHVNEPATDAQLRGISWRCNKLGLDVKHVMAQVANRGQASAVIGTLDQRIKNMPAASAQQPPATNMQTPRPQIPLRMAQMIKPGRYALRADAAHEFVFFRVSCPTTGRRQGVFKIQTQHGEQLRDRIEYLPSGRIVKLDSSRIDGIPLADWITMLIPVQADAAIDYGRELERCCRCGTELTDAESRWYCIGPECTKHWPWIHEQVLATRGEFVPV